MLQHVHGCLRVIALGLMLMVGHAVAAEHVVSGLVSSYLDGEPVPRATVSVLVDDVRIGWTTTATDGTYEIAFSDDIAADATGEVHVNAAGFVYQSVSFQPSDPATTLDFSLRTPGRIRGTVTDAQSGVPLAGILVRVAKFEGTTWIDNMFTNGLGEFTTYAMAPGTYRVCAGGIDTEGRPLQCFDRHEILDADDLAGGTPIELTDGEQIDDIDFPLQHGGIMRGVLRNGRTGLGIANVQFQALLYDSLGRLLDEDSGFFTGEDGSYEIRGVPPGTFYIAVGILQGTMKGTQLYPGIDCPQGVCPPATDGQAIAVPPGGTVEGIDFTFHPYATISGTVTDRTSGAPLDTVNVTACRRPVVIWNPSCFAATPDPVSGHYALDLADGDYTLFASAPDTHVDVIFPDRPCLPSRCLNNDQPSIALEPGANPGYDFSVRRSAHIRGALRFAATGEPPEHYEVAVFDESFKFLFLSWWPQGDGSYRTPKWVGGTYYLAAYQGWGSLCGMYLDRPCPPTQTDPVAMAAVAPTPVVVADGEIREGIDINIFEVSPGDEVFASGFE